MIHWRTAASYFQVLAILLAVLIFSLGVFTGSKLNIATPYVMQEVEKGESDYEIPVLSLPVSYFDDERIVGSGEYTNGSEYFVISEGYQSAPTTSVALSEDNYNNEGKSLPAFKNTATILENSELFKDEMHSQLDEFGVFAQRFLPEYEIAYMKEFDVDNDGKNEHIIGVCGWGGNGCPHEALIVKDDKIIFSVEGVIDPEIVTAGTSNGFYVQWAPWRTDGSKWDVGLCCMPGYFKTRFIYTDGEFLPVYEQEVLNFRIKTP